MLIITADDLGIDKQTTDNILYSYKIHGITSASAMLFMTDSIRAAEVSSQLALEIGLHLNFTLSFSSFNAGLKLKEHQNAVASYLLSSKFAQIIYNPLLRKSFDYLFKAQQEEFYRVYGKYPSFYNGHHHMHLCSNIIFEHFLPPKIPIRRTFTFGWGEKDPVNIIYRRLIDRFINNRYISTDYFFSLAPTGDLETFRRLIAFSRIKNIELMVHPNRHGDFFFIQSNEYFKFLNSTKLGLFNEIKPKKVSK